MLVKLTTVIDYWYQALICNKNIDAKNTVKTVLGCSGAEIIEFLVLT